MDFILVERDGYGWKEFSGPPRNLERIHDTANLHCADGRVEEIDVEPYPVSMLVDPRVLLRLVRDGAWTKADLAPLGLDIAAPFVTPEGKTRIGEAHYEEENGAVFQRYAVEDLPPPPAPPTIEDKLVAAGLTVAEMEQLIAGTLESLASKAKG